MDITAELDSLRERLELDRETNIGFPGAVDFDYTEVLPFFGYLLNNVGDPFVDCVGRSHTKDWNGRWSASSPIFWVRPPMTAGAM
jgi:histidine decarboxylase